MSIAAIAQRAGVSVATVSRVLNNNPSVRPETAEQVRRALEQMSYNPLAVRRGPKMGKRVTKEMQNIAVLVIGQPQEIWFRRPVFSAVLAGVTRAANDRGINISIGEILDPVALNTALRGGALDGALVFVPSNSDLRLFEGLRAAVPVVRIMGEESPICDADHVAPDHLAAGRVAFDYLASRGCSRMAFVTTRADHEAFLLRAMGFQVSAFRAGAAQPTAFAAGNAKLLGLSAMSLVQCDSLETVAEKIAQSPQRPDGLFVSQDAEAIGLFSMLMQHGIRPGKDIQIISCNNEQSSLAMLRPRPATIDIGADQMGRWAVTRLVNRVSRPEEPPIRMLVSPKLVVSPEDVASSASQD